jgi:electron transport complex protein RnfA
MLFNILASILSGVLVSNVMTHGLGLETIIEPQTRIKPVFIKCSIVAVMSLLVFGIDIALVQFVLIPFDLMYLHLLIVMFLLICVNELYQVIQPKVPFLPHEPYMGIHSILLVPIIYGLGSVSLGDATIQMFAAAIGFVATSVLFTVIISRIRVNPLLKGFKGLPILLIILGLIAMVLSGLKGIF